MAAIKRSIDLAARLGVRTVVAHAGQVRMDFTAEIQLRELFETKKENTARYADLKQVISEERASLVGPHLEAVKRSLHELLDYAARSGIRLGLENRYHVPDIPSQEEMGFLLELAGPERLGFIYDSGHGIALHRLGFYDNETWLKRFAERLFGMHLHDAIGIMDHYAPGLGDVDFDMIARYLPAQAFRTIEVRMLNTTEQLKEGLSYLHKHGCIKLSNEVEEFSHEKVL